MEWIDKKTTSQEKELPWLEKETVFTNSQKKSKTPIFFFKKNHSSREEHSLLHSEMENLRFAIGLPSSPIENDFEKLKKRQQEDIARKKGSFGFANLKIYTNENNIFKGREDNFGKKIAKDFSKQTQHTDGKYTYIRIHNKDKFRDEDSLSPENNFSNNFSFDLSQSADAAGQEELDIKKRIAALQEKIDARETQPIKIAALEKRKEFLYDINALKENYLQQEQREARENPNLQDFSSRNFSSRDFSAAVSDKPISDEAILNEAISKERKNIFVYNYKQEQVAPASIDYPYVKNIVLTSLQKEEPLYETAALYLKPKTEQTVKSAQTNIDPLEMSKEQNSSLQAESGLSQKNEEKALKEKDLSRYRIIVNEEFQNNLPSFDSRSFASASQSDNIPQPLQQEQWNFDPSSDPWLDHEPSLKILRSEDISHENIAKENANDANSATNISAFEKPNLDETNADEINAKTIESKTQEAQEPQKTKEDADELKSLFQGEKNENLLSKQFSAPPQNKTEALDSLDTEKQWELEKKNSNEADTIDKQDTKREQVFELNLASTETSLDEPQDSLDSLNSQEIITPEEIILSQELAQREEENAEENNDNNETENFAQAETVTPPVENKTEKVAQETLEQNSITPQVVFNKQYFLKLNSLKTNKNKFISDPVEIQNVIAKLEETLGQFNIEGRVVGLQQGPIITRYEIKIPPGIKVSRLLGLTDELAMALEAMKVRIEAPIPGRSTAGIEIPNKKRQTVYLGDIVNDESYKESGAHLPLPFGKDIAGNSVIEDLVNMPHLLIAGATGSGKSVAVNTFITSLILTKTPEEVRFLLVDPKLVELSHYNEIPHLLHPVITDYQKAILALNWAVEEMERRYEDLVELRVRDIRSYNEKVKEKKSIPQMPYIVILIDELGDLMMVAGKDVESSIIRLTQKARAVGIHLILATQRPSVDVITALIKANCPARISLQVAQKTDSRTILDGNGAEQLLGKGDMLFRHPSKGQLQRIQCPYVEDYEVEEIVNQVKNMGKASYIALDDPQAGGMQMDPENEELMDEAWQIILESQKASASYLQRRLRIGYNRAARIIEAFEAKGWIGPQTGSKPREILATL